MTAIKSVLIVDDEEDTLKLLKMIVELSGYEAFITLNSMEAITMAQVEQPDVVLLDVMMPKLDGFQLCKMLRADPKTRDLPVIFVTAYSSLDIEDRRIESGGDMVLPKPVGMDELVAAIESVQSIERTVPQEIQKAAADITQARSPCKGKSVAEIVALAANEKAVNGNATNAPAATTVVKSPLNNPITDKSPATNDNKS
jgi:DNA-binding response OmpR family regulator